MGPAALATICGVPGAVGHPPERLEHVIVVMMENRDAGAVARSGEAPYFDELLGQCASSTAFLDDLFPWDMPSLPHYLALTSGSNCDAGFGDSGSRCITDDGGPSDHRLGTRSIFEQVSWKAYQEDMPYPCGWDGSGAYVPRHNPPVYYSRLDGCDEHDVPIPRVSCSGDGGCSPPHGALVDDLRDDALPELAFVTPDLRNDMHDGSVSQGDDWLRTYLPLVFDSPAYRRGATVVYVLWDEQAHGRGGPTPNLFVAPWVGHRESSAPMDLVSVLGAIEDQLGVERLGCASGTPPGGVGACPRNATADLRSIFGL